MADDLAGRDVSRGEQRGVAPVIRGDGLRAVPPQRPDPRGPVQRLNLRRVPETEHHGARRGTQIEAHDIDPLVLKPRVGGEFECPDPVRLETAVRPDPLDRGGTHPVGIRQGRAPPRRPPQRRRGLGGRKDGRRCVRRNGGRATATGEDADDPREAIRGKPGAPAADGDDGDAHLCGHAGIGRVMGGQPEDPGLQNLAMGSGVRLGPGR